MRNWRGVMLNLPGVVIRDSDRDLSTWGGGGGAAHIRRGPQPPVSDAVLELILELAQERRAESETSRRADPRS